MFKFVLGDRQKVSKLENVDTRKAIRAIVMRKDKILLVFTNKGDYKFPGGGVIVGESYEETLTREVKEETGYIITDIEEMAGQVIERNTHTKDSSSVFEMTSDYYVCKVSNDVTRQNLDAYEVELDFKATWIQIDDAIKSNEKLINNIDEQKNPWIYRETTVLKQLKKFIDNK